MATTTKQASIRIGLDGKAEVKAGLKEVRDDGTKAFGDVQTAAEKSNAAMDANADKIDKAAQALANHKARAAAAAADPPPVTPGNDNPQPKISYAQKQVAAGIISQVDPVAAAQVSYAKAVKQADAALAAELITEKQHADFVGKSKKVLDEVAEAYNATGKAIGFNRGQMQELTAIGRHSFDQLAAGASVTRTAETHIFSLAQALGSGEGGLAGGFAAVGALLNPITIGLAAFAAGLVGVGLHMKSLSDSEEALTTQQARLSDGTVKNVAALADNAKAIRDLGASLSDATVEVQTFVAAGVDPSRMREFGKAARDAADALGIDVKDTAKAAATAFTGNYEQVAKLDDQLNFLTASERENIKAMFDSGEAAAARSEALRIFDEKMAAAAQTANGPFKTALRDLKVDLDQVLDDFSRSDWAQNFGGSVDFVLGKLDLLAKALRSDPDPEDISKKLVFAQRKAIEDAQRLAGAGNGKSAFLISQQVQGDLADVRKYAALLKQFPASSKDTKAEGTQVDEKAFNAAILSADPHASEIETLKARAKTISDGLDASFKKTPEKIAAANKALADINRQIADLEKPKGHGRADQLKRDAAAADLNVKATLDLAKAYGEGDAAALKAEAVRKASVDATRKGTDLATASARALQQAIADTALSGAKSAAGLSDQASAQKAVNAQVAAGTLTAQAAQRALQEEAQLRPLVVAASLADGDAKKQLLAIIEKLKGAQKDLNEQTAVSALQSDAQSNRDQIDFLKLQLDLIGKTNEQRAVEIAQFQATQRIKAQPIDINDPQQLGAALDDVLGAGNVARQGVAVDNAKYSDDLKRQQENDIALTQKKLEIVGKTADAQDAILGRLRLEQELKQQFGSLDAEDAQAALKRYDAQVKLNAELAKAQNAQDEIRKAQDQLFSDLEDYLDGGKLSWKSFGDFARSVIDDVSKELIKLAVINPLKKAAGETDVTTLSDILSSKANGGGDILSSIGHILGFATGTDSAPAGYAWVGENGPELMKLRAGDIIKPHDASLKMASGNTPGSASGASYGPTLDAASIQAMTPRLNVSPTITLHISGNPSADQIRAMKKVASDISAESVRSALTEYTAQMPGMVNSITKKNDPRRR